VNQSSFSLLEPRVPGAIAVRTSTKVMTDADVIFTVNGGPIEIITLFSTCVTLNDGSVVLARYRGNPTAGSQLVFSGFTSSLANIPANSVFVLDPQALSTGPPLTSGTGVSLGGAKNGIIIPEGTIQLSISGGPTTGTWRHCMSYRPLDENSTVVGA